MSTVHSPAPWYLGETGETYENCMPVLSELGHPIAHVETWDMEEWSMQEQARKNAALIVTAPDLLAALEDIVSNAKRYLEDVSHDAIIMDADLIRHYEAILRRARA